MADLPLTGRCLCGAVCFEVTEPPRGASYCHCTRCQRRTGTSSSAQAQIDGNAFRFTAGEAFVKGWRHPDGGMEKCFCTECGGHLFSRSFDDHAWMAIRMSAFDSDPGVRPTFRSHVGTAAYWEEIPDDGLPRYEGPMPKR